MVEIEKLSLDEAGGGSFVADHTSGRRMSLISMAVFDVGGPLALYYGLRASGSSTVVALIVSGLLPALGIALGVRRHRSVDAIGVVVLFGILLGTVVGLASGNARLVLLDGTVPTAALGAVCIGSLRTSRPLMYRVALQFVGAASPQGRQFERLWQHRQFRHVFAVITVVWGVAFVAETLVQIAIIETASATTAKTTANVVPIVVAAVAAAWTSWYGRRRRARGEREAAEAATAAAADPAAAADDSTPTAASTVSTSTATPTATDTDARVHPGLE